jgi:hypothetical protein
MQGILSYIGEAHQFEMLQHQILDIFRVLEPRREKNNQANGSAQL